MKRETWQPWEEEFLAEVVDEFPIKVIASKLERSESSILNKIARLGIKRFKADPVVKWSQDEVELFLNNTNAEISVMTGRPINEIADKRLAWNIARNGWDRFDPERAA